MGSQRPELAQIRLWHRWASAVNQAPAQRPPGARPASHEANRKNFYVVTGMLREVEAEAERTHRRLRLSRSAKYLATWPDLPLTGPGFPPCPQAALQGAQTRCGPKFVSSGVRAAPEEPRLSDMVILARPTIRVKP